MLGCAGAGAGAVGGQGVQSVAPRLELSAPIYARPGVFRQALVWHPSTGSKHAKRCGNWEACCQADCRLERPAFLEKSPGGDAMDGIGPIKRRFCRHVAAFGRLAG